MASKNKSVDKPYDSIFKKCFRNKTDREIFIAQGGLDILDRYEKFFGAKSFLTFLQRTKINYSNTMRSSYDAYTTMTKKFTTIVLRYQAKSSDTSNIQNIQIDAITHELGHAMFRDVWGCDMEEGLPILTEALILQKTTNDIREYEACAIRVFYGMKQYAQKHNTSIKKVYLSMALGYNEDNIREKISMDIQHSIWNWEYPPIVISNNAKSKLYSIDIKNMENESNNLPDTILDKFYKHTIISWFNEMKYS